MNHRDAAVLRTAPSAQAEAEAVAVAVAAKPDTPHPRADPFTWRCPRTLGRSRRSAFETLQPYWRWRHGSRRAACTQGALLVCQPFADFGKNRFQPRLSLRQQLTFS